MLLAFALIQSGVAAPAPLATPQPAQAQQEKLCKRVKQAGSNLPKKICLTRDEWMFQAVNGREKAEAANRPF
jgi:hypothetical protein